MIFSVERTGFIDCKLLVNSILTDLEANGLTRKFPTTTLTSADTKGVYEVSATVDPLALTQPWRIRMEAIDESHMTVVIATPNQLPDDGSLTYNDDGIEISGHLGVKTVVGPAFIPSADTVFINRANLAVDQRASSPMSYRMSVTPHGIALFVWEPGNDVAGNNQSWLVVQRTVNNGTGIVRTTGKSPVLCLYGIKHTSPGAGVAVSPTVDVTKRFTVREADIVRPTVSLSLTSDGPDSNRGIASSQLVAITEENNYVISFPNGLNTQRFAYPADEIDMLGYTSADVISQNSDISITVYGETAPRIYKAMSSNGPNNTGVRILLLASGGNI